MTTPSNTLRSMADRLNALVDTIVDRIALKTTATACSSQFHHTSCWAQASCGTNKCIAWYFNSCDGQFYGFCRSKSCVGESDCYGVT